MPIRNYSNVAIPDTLAVPGGGNLSSTGTQIFAASGAPSGYPGSFPWTLRIEPGTSSEELVNVTAGAGTSASPWTIQRNYDGTLARGHNAGVPIQHGTSANDYALSRAHEAAGSGSGVHGLPAAAWQASSFAVISETTLSDSTHPSVSWSAIPQTYAHLLVVVQGRSTSISAQHADLSLTVNGNTSNVYSYLEIGADTESGTLTGPYVHSGFALANWPFTLEIPASQAGTAANAGGGWILLPNYSGTAFNKMFTCQTGWGNGSNSALRALTRWGWFNPSSQAAITSLSLALASGNYLTGSFFGLYGLGG